MKQEKIYKIIKENTKVNSGTRESIVNIFDEISGTDG